MAGRNVFVQGTDGRTCSARNRVCTIALINLPGLSGTWDHWAGLRLTDSDRTLSESV
jgi:hypothetical protein